jgi:hypothetical protein
MKGLFKSKPRTPLDVVRELLIYLDLQSGSHDVDAKREEKVRSNPAGLLAPIPQLGQRAGLALSYRHRPAVDEEAINTNGRLFFIIDSKVPTALAK